MKEKNKKRFLAASLRRRGNSILGWDRDRTIKKVFWLETDDLGYTSASREVFISWNHKTYIEPLEEEKRMVVRVGIFAHELLHQLLTNFKYTQEVGDTLLTERKVFYTMSNLIEDPAIEYFAPKMFGGHLLKSLKYTIKYIWELSPPISESKSAFQQFMNALIQFGDMGIVKGEFTFPEAQQAFKDNVVLFNKAITCPDSKKRIDYALELTNNTKELWKSESLETLEDLLKNLSGNSFSDTERNDGTSEPLSEIPMDFGEEESESEADEDSATAKRRSEFCKKLEELDEKSDEKDSLTDDESTSSKEMSDSEDTDVEVGTSSSCKSSTKASKDSEPDDGKNNSDVDLPEFESFDGIEDTDDMDIDNTYQNILDDMEKEGASEKEVETSSIDDNLDIQNINVLGRNTFSSYNEKVIASPNDIEDYHNWVIQNKVKIDLMTKQLKDVISRCQDEDIRSTSGKLNVMRSAKGTTLRMFDKKRDKGDVSDMAVFLLIDLSGSMAGLKLQKAKETAMIVAETLAALNIPSYIMGFGADDYRDADHYHFKGWNGGLNERASIICMDSVWNNFDSYSIQYASEILNKRSESNKVLIIISDGLPMAHAYAGYSSSEIYSDMKHTISNARGHELVFGIGIGDCSPSVLKEMYGHDFIHIPNCKGLTNAIAKRLKDSIIRSFEQ